MGEHKHNPTAIAAKNGELPPKPDAAQRNAMIFDALMRAGKKRMQRQEDPKIVENPEIADHRTA